MPGSEPDTLVEPDIAVSPVNPALAVAVAHDGRYPDGGAVGIEHAWTRDGGATWHHAPLPGVTVTTGGEAAWARASDPVVAYGPDGAAYVSTLVFDTGCNSGVVVSKSVDGGRTFAEPVVAHRSASCDVSDDKNWLVVDTSPNSPHRGRLYQFWTPFLTDMFGNADGSPQALVWSDDGGTTWTTPSTSVPRTATRRTRNRCSDPAGRSSTPTWTTAPTGPPRDQRPPPPAPEPTGRSAAAESVPEARREHRIPRPDHGNVHQRRRDVAPRRHNHPRPGQRTPRIPLLPSLRYRRSRHGHPVCRVELRERSESDALQVDGRQKHVVGPPLWSTGPRGVCSGSTSMCPPTPGQCPCRTA